MLSNKSGSTGTSSEVSLGSFIMPRDGDLLITFNSTYSNGGKLFYYKNGNVGNDLSYSGSTNNITKRIDDFYKSGNTVELKIKGVGGTTGVSNFNVDIILFQMEITIFEVVPNEVKEIGQLATCFLYGMDTDGTYKGGIITGTTTSATTGSITTGNCVGFLEINYNGQIVKVPYYN